MATCEGNSPVPGDFPAQRPVTRIFEVFFDLRPNKRLSKQWWHWWLETPSCPLWRHCNGVHGSCLAVFCWGLVPDNLTHWGRVTHICVRKLTIIGSDNGLSPGRRQAIIWTNDWILLTRTLGTNFSEFLSEFHTFSFQKKRLKVSSAKWRPFRLAPMF